MSHQEAIVAPSDKHISTCAMLTVRPCPSDKSLHGELVGEHWWSGWPGAYCLKCGDGDASEICLGGCACPCHDAFWKAYDEATRESRG